VYYQTLTNNGTVDDLENLVLIAPPPICTGDINGDGSTDVFDFSIFAGHFGQAVAPGTNGDLDNNGTVNVFDFSIFAGDFGCTP
jgi:hypothetical protein